MGEDHQERHLPWLLPSLFLSPLMLPVLQLLAVVQPVRCSAALHMSLQRAQWSAGGQLQDALVSECLTTASSCLCQSACLARPECLSVSVSAGSDGRFECRLSEHRGHPELLRAGAESAELWERPGRGRLLDWCDQDECETVGATCRSSQCVCAAGLTPDGQQCQCGDSYGPPASGPCAFRDCAELYRAGARVDGVYTLSPLPNSSVEVPCDMSTDGGGWTLVQRRVRQRQDAFGDEDWSGYRDVMNHSDGHFWLGNWWLHALTAAEPQALRVELESVDGAAASAEYSTFGVGSEQQEFALQVDGFRDGGAGDGLSALAGAPFTTRQTGRWQCEDAGWWSHSLCEAETNLNGVYPALSVTRHGPVWMTWQRGLGLAKSKMMIRPRNFPVDSALQGTTESKADSDGTTATSATTTATETSTTETTITTTEPTTTTTKTTTTTEPTETATTITNTSEPAMTTTGTNTTAETTTTITTTTTSSEPTTTKTTTTTPESTATATTTTASEPTTTATTTSTPPEPTTTATATTASEPTTTATTTTTTPEPTTTATTTTASGPTTTATTTTTAPEPTTTTTATTTTNEPVTTTTRSTIATNPVATTTNVITAMSTTTATTTRQGVDSDTVQRV